MGVLLRKNVKFNVFDGFKAVFWWINGIFNKFQGNFWFLIIYYGGLLRKYVKFNLIDEFKAVFMGFFDEELVFLINFKEISGF